jgi:isopenicillin-N epimerase
MRDLFMLDPDVVFLTHGTFGACPRRVFERYQAWQLELEREPVDFILRRLDGLLEEARGSLAAYVGADRDDLTFVQNATTGVNMAARSLDLQPGDEVLATGLEYGACDLAWEAICAHAGARYVRAEMPLPVGDVVEALFARQTDRTRVVYASHITSATGLLLPIEEIVSRARNAGLITIVDGAHAPGHVPVDLESLGADFYSANCHKWLCAPKGAGFLHVRREHQQRVEGPIVSWGHAERSTFISRTQEQGTRDAAAYLSVHDAIAFQQEHAWDDVRARCVALCREARRDLCELLGTEPIAPEEMVRQMASVQLPDGVGESLARTLWDEHRIDIPVMRPQKDLLRISIAAYTTRDDVDRLLEALPGALAKSLTSAGAARL